MMRQLICFALSLAFAGSQLFSQDPILPPDGPQLEGVVLEVFRGKAASGHVIGTILVEGSTPPTEKTSLTVTQDTRIWEKQGTAWVAATLDSVQEGTRIVVWFVDSRAYLTYPIQATAEVILIIRAASVSGNPSSRSGASEEEPLRISANALASRLVHRVEPDYPALAKEIRLQGIVLLQVVVDKEGRVEEAKLIRGHPLLRDAARKAVLQWRYEPFTLEGGPIKVVAAVVVSFRLEDR